MGRIRGASAAIVCIAAVLAAGCDRAPAPPYALVARAGVYDDGSGRDGLAVVATLRDASGRGPSSTWDGALSSPAGRVATPSYSGAGPGSFAAWWWPGVPPTPGRYALDLY